MASDSLRDKMRGYSRTHASTHSAHPWQAPLQKVSDRSNTPRIPLWERSENDEERSKSHTHQIGTSHGWVQKGKAHKGIDPSQRLTFQLRSKLTRSATNGTPRLQPEFATDVRASSTAKDQPLPRRLANPIQGQSLPSRSVCLSVCLSVWPQAAQSEQQGQSLPSRSVCLSVCLSVGRDSTYCLSVYLSICLSVL